MKNVREILILCSIIMHRSMLSTVAIVQGDAQLERGDYQLAAESYSKAMELDPSSPVFPASKAKALFQQQL